MKIEILFPEIANQYGEIATIEWIKRSFSDVIPTSLTDEPVFIKDDVDMVFIASMDMMEYTIVLEKLTPYKDKIVDYIQGNKFFCAMGSAIDLFLESSERAETTRFGLGIIKAKVLAADLPFEKKTYEYRWEKVVATSLANGQIECEDSLLFLKREKKKSDIAIRDHNFFGFNCVGPFFVQNINFFSLLLSEVDLKKEEFFEEELLKEIYVNRVLK